VHSGAYFSRRLRLALVIAAAATMMLVTSAGRLNLSYLTPDGHVAVDQALLTDTPLKVCALTFDDGPDGEYTQQVLAVLDDMISERGMGLIFISHDLNLIASFCDRILIMYGGQVMEECRAAELEQAQHPYTRGLLDCLPRLDAPRAPLPTLKRDPAWLTE